MFILEGFIYYLPSWNKIIILLYYVFASILIIIGIANLIELIGKSINDYFGLKFIEITEAL